MTEPISFGANGCSESCKCNQKFWIYPQQNKGRDKNLIIKQTKMTKIRNLIEKIWWVIPPIIVFFGIPLYYTINEMIKFSLPPKLFIIWYGKHLAYILEAFTLFSGFVLIFFLGFMGIGYYLVRKKSSLLLRITVLTILGMIGWIVGMFALLIIGGGAH
jgi:hypothetical protein